MKTAVVILNWNTKELLERFLPGLVASTEGLDAEVIVADNASTDGSLDWVAGQFPSVRRIPLDRNYGFTGGYNRALAEVEADYYVLINSDIEVSPDWLGPLTDWMDAHPDCAACGPKLRSWQERDRFEYAGAAGGLIDRFGYPFCRGRILKMLEKDEGQYDTPADVFWISGACLLVRSRVWKELGGLDDRFFAHMEEIDLCWRMQLAGWRVSVVPASVVWHVGGGTLPATSPRKLKLNFRNNLLMLENNLARTFAAEIPERPLTAKQLRQCERHAWRRIRQRMVLDGVAAGFYLLTGRWSSFRAVLGAHREFREMGRNAAADLSQQAPVTLRGRQGMAAAAIQVLKRRLLRKSASGNGGAGTDN